MRSEYEVVQGLVTLRFGRTRHDGIFLLQDTRCVRPRAGYATASVEEQPAKSSHFAAHAAYLRVIRSETNVAHSRHRRCRQRCRPERRSSGPGYRGRPNSRPDGSAAATDTANALNCRIRSPESGFRFVFAAATTWDCEHRRGLRDAGSWRVTGECGRREEVCGRESVPDARGVGSAGAERAVQHSSADPVKLSSVQANIHVRYSVQAR